MDDSNPLTRAHNRLSLIPGIVADPAMYPSLAKEIKNRLSETPAMSNNLTTQQRIKSPEEFQALIRKAAQLIAKDWAEDTREPTVDRFAEIVVQAFLKVRSEESSAAGEVAVDAQVVGGLLESFSRMSLGQE